MNLITNYMWQTPKITDPYTVTILGLSYAALASQVTNYNLTQVGKTQKGEWHGTWERG